MRKIYLKNFKGFDSEIIELKEVNFFVGENSTGKTSLLKAINLLSSQELIYNRDFNAFDFELGYFEEIISKQSTEPFFSLGFEKNSSENPFNYPNLRILYTFTNLDSLPQISSIKIRIGDHNVLIELNDGDFRYRFKKYSNSNFEKWVEDFKFPKKTVYRKYYTSNTPISMMISFVEMDLNTGRGLSMGVGPILLYDNHKWMAPIRAKAQRTYESYNSKFTPEGSHIPFQLRQILSKKDEKQRKDIISILKQFGSESNLFDNIEVREFGKDDGSPFELLVKYNGMEIKLPNTGYGVSQCLPLLIEILSAVDSSFSIQQPEVHLHPKAQSAFGSFLFNAAKIDRNIFLVETHSDYTINRFRYKLSKNPELNLTTQILFFQRESTGNNITTIMLNKDGSYKQLLPENYTKFFIDEELNLLEI